MSVIYSRIYFKRMLMAAIFFVVCLPACSSMKSFFAMNPSESESKPIENPFGVTENNSSHSNDNYTWRAKKGDRSVELEIPRNSATDFEMPMDVKFGQDESTKNIDGIDYQYQAQKATMADREIASTFNQSANREDERNQHEIEQTLGLRKSDELPNMDESYLAKMDVIKQLFNSGRYEASLLEIDRQVKIYPTSSRLFEMRGTVLDRMGYRDLAVRSWKQALEFEPNRVSLKRLIEKREQQRAVASERR